jgi:hypothetical protein
MFVCPMPPDQELPIEIKIGQQYVGSYRSDMEKRLLQRVQLTGDESPGNFNFTADIVKICSNYLDLWSMQYESAPSVSGAIAQLDQASSVLRQEANKIR